MLRTGSSCRVALLILCGAAMLSQTGGVEPPTGRLPNVLIVTVDTLRADRLGAYGYSRNTSPVIDKLMREGVRFTQARTVEPLTGPALCSMLTSRYPHEHGGSRNGLRMRSGMASLPKALQAQGYRTSAFVGNWTLRDKLSGLAEHFEYYEEVISRRRWFGLVKGEATADDLNEAFDVWLDDHAGRHGDRPFMAWVHYVEPHAPYRNQKAFHGQLGFPKNQALGDKEKYDTEIAAVDAAFGELLEIAGKKINLDETLIVFASDHGESLGEHGYWGHGRHLYEPTLHIPMSIRWPGRVAPGTVDAPALLIDLAPTILGLIDTEGNAPFAGFDWTAVLDGGEPPMDRITRYQAHRGAVLSKHDSDLARKAGLLAVGLIEKNRKEIFRMERNRRWLFDLEADPKELDSLTRVNEHPTEGLLGWMRTVYEGLGEFDSTIPAPLDEESVKALKSLGYVD
ncbi:MAG: sulfatase-like hydrolase/transferase [Acidobacteria bacterium]|nr:sulfatase-like hydrolase/transferase [Acidobacteriota bacterium]NIM62556.1 sulfatase-like hydrolase/transferase [Acidobacteriota bacterium]NIO58289.1 sulfatase-like hydrolase/transferase [Acidobacteriota bacterium]NIQ29345.1 sulfatase-like hydrolase/transferase [Acidobacteriota bacterium]NIQ83945.1 sulfatase-like hydrolase/transferase [Acidobacteriota bacterium]